MGCNAYVIWADSSRGKSGLGAGYTYLLVARPIVKVQTCPASQHAYVMPCAKPPLSLACYSASTRLPSRPRYRYFTHPRVLRNNRPCTYRPLFNDSSRIINISEQKYQYDKVGLFAGYAPLPTYLALPIYTMRYLTLPCRGSIIRKDASHHLSTLI